jgi:hypothetical protein
VPELIDIANRFGDGKDAYSNKRTRSLKTTEETGIAISGEDPTIMITTAPIVK